MKKVTSRGDLQDLRAKYRDFVLMRLLSYDSLNRTEVTITMGECGLASGARETLKALFDEVNNARLEDVSVIAVDCAGKCAEEPIVHVTYPGKEPIVYKNVNPAQAKEIVATLNSARTEV